MGLQVLVVGASGLIGRAVAARLAGDGYDVVGVSRSGAAYSIPSIHWVRLDLRDAVSEAAWMPYLKTVDAVVNCAGVLQDNDRDSTTAAHAAGPAALCRACETAGIRKVIHVSAIGVDRDSFSKRSSKRWIATKAHSGLDGLCAEVAPQFRTVG